MDYSPWVERENWPFLRVAVSPKPERSHPPKLVCMYVTSRFICMIFFESIPIDWIFWWPWTIVHGPKGKIGRFWKYQYLRNRRGHAHQNRCTCMLHQSIFAWIFWANSEQLNFLMTMDYSPWSEGKNWLFLKVPISPKPERSRPPKSVYMHVTSIYICMNFLSQFRAIKFFDDHGL